MSLATLDVFKKKWDYFFFVLKSKVDDWFYRLREDIIHCEEHVFGLTWRDFVDLVALLNLLFVVSLEAWKTEFAV